MEAAVASLDEALGTVAIARARVPVYANVSGEPVTEPEAIRRTLRAQLLSAVRWEQTLRAMIGAGVRAFVEVGHGRVLRGLVRGVDKEAALFGTEDPESVEATAQALAGAPA
jgi:[acyl-carrier-protein] S-malonyltransferase